MKRDPLTSEQLVERKRSVRDKLRKERAELWEALCWTPEEMANYYAMLDSARADLEKATEKDDVIRAVRREASIEALIRIRLMRPQKKTAPREERG